MAKIIGWAEKLGARSLREHAARNLSSVLDQTPPAVGVSLEARTEARVSGGHWIARCPTDGCSGREYVNFADPVFFCCECRNAETGHHPVAVTVPAPAMRAKIESALLARPAPGTRNWRPEETVAFLRKENREHGVPNVD